MKYFVIIFIILLIAISGNEGAAEARATIEERKIVLLNTCYPPPSYSYVNAAALCPAFKEYIEGL